MVERSDPLDGVRLLNEIVAFVRRFVVLGQDQADAVALWVAHTHAFDMADSTPYLHITSPEKRSGKTRLLEVLELLVCRPWFTGRVTAAVLARKVDKERPTLLLDESDAAFKGPAEYVEALRGMLNTGHRRGGKASVCVGQGANISYRDFSTFCPKAIAGIDKLPDTVADRSIPIVLQRRKASEPVERFRRRRVEPEANALRECLMAWVSSLRLQDAEPDLPPELDDRAADGWEPLLAIADAAGGEWPRRARVAAIELSASAVREEQSLGARLLADIKGGFEAAGADKMPSSELVAALTAVEEGLWADLSGRPLDAAKLARLLKPYGIVPKNIRLESKVVKGYDRRQFLDAWDRYAAAFPRDFAATSATPDMAQIQNASRYTGMASKGDVAAPPQIPARYDVAPVAARGQGKEGAVTNPKSDGEVKRWTI